MNNADPDINPARSAIASSVVGALPEELRTADKLTVAIDPPNCPFKLR
jgi:hypothetical protein